MAEKMTQVEAAAKARQRLAELRNDPEWRSRYAERMRLAQQARHEAREQASPRTTAFAGADLTGANLSGADLRDVSFAGANLTGANLSDANLSDCDLSGATLTGANLKNVKLAGANLTGARF